MSRTAVILCTLAILLAVAFVALWHFLGSGDTHLAIPPDANPNPQSDNDSRAGVAGSVTTPADPTTPPPEPIAPLRSKLEAETRATIRGRCVDEDGTPLAGVKARLAANTNFEKRLAQYRMEHGEPRWTAPEPVVSDADGRFELKFDPPPPYGFGVTVMPTGRVWARQQWPQLEPASITDMGAIVLPRGVDVRGTVVDSDGVAVSNCDLSLRAKEPASEPPSDRYRLDSQGYARTDAGGSFDLSWSLSPGLYALTAGIRQVREPTGAIELALPSATLRVVVEPSPDAKEPTITGTVVDTRGVPITRASIFCDDPPNFAEANSRRNGTFELRRRERLPVGHVPLAVTADGYTTWKSGQPVDWGTHDLRIVLDAGPPLTIRVRRAHDDTPIERFGIRRVPYRPGSWSSTDEDVFYAGVHPQGVLEIEHATTGRFVFTVVPAESTGLPISAERDVEIQPGVPALLEFRLAPIAERIVELVSRSGAPVSGARVELLWNPALDRVHLGTFAFDAQSWRLNSPESTALLSDDAQTDQQGRATVHGREELEYVLRLPGPGNVPQLVRPFRLDVSDIAQVVVNTGATIRGRITPPELIATLRAEAGLAPEGAVAAADESYLPKIELRGTGSRQYQTFPSDVIHRRGVPIGGDGTFRIAGIPEGIWRVILQSSRQNDSGRGNSSRCIQEQLALADGDDRELVLDLTTLVRHPVALQIDIDGRPHVGTATLATKLGTDANDQEYLQVSTDEQGTARVGLPEGEWQATANASFERQSFYLPGPRFVVGKGQTPVVVPMHLQSARRQIVLEDPDGAVVLRARAMIEDPTDGSRQWAEFTDGKWLVIGPPGTRHLRVRRAPLCDEKAYGEWTNQHKDGDEWLRAWIDLGDVDMAPGVGATKTIRLPAEWRELPK